MGDGEESGAGPDIPPTPKEGVVVVESYNGEEIVVSSAESEDGHPYLPHVDAKRYTIGIVTGLLVGVLLGSDLGEVNIFWFVLVILVGCMPIIILNYSLRSGDDDAG